MIKQLVKSKDKIKAYNIEKNTFKVQLSLPPPTSEHDHSGVKEVELKNQNLKNQTMR